MPEQVEQPTSASAPTLSNIDTEGVVKPSSVNDLGRSSGTKAVANVPPPAIPPMNSINDVLEFAKEEIVAIAQDKRYFH